MRTLNTFWGPRLLTSDLWKDMDQIFDNFAVPSKSYDEREFFLGADLEESEEHYMLSMDLPGLKKEDIKIEAVENRLTVSGERKGRTFSRSFVLPKSVNIEAIEARYENGVLEFYLPKVQVAKARKIEIQSSGKGGFFDKLLGTKKKESTEEPKEVTGPDKAS